MGIYRDLEKIIKQMGGGSKQRIKDPSPLPNKTNIGGN